ncbi:MAG: hypothetical protein IJT88_08295 [Kiritimatiellae bacterium]|nr:hypothetical protein [Kiritimatiellia bacterium]
MQIQVADQRAQDIIERFLEIAAIPRASGHEGALAQYLLDWAAARHLRSEQDKAGNVRIDLPATAGRAAEGAILLQAHMDMVAAPDPDGVPAPVLAPDGKTLRARHSTLGADDGIGIAIILSILDSPPASHPALRALFTVEEETTMAGAEALSPDWLADAQGLLNIDWEEAGVACVASAGCKLLTLSRMFESWTPVSAAHAYSVALRDFPGGHSGLDIGRGIPNPVLVLARAMSLGLEVLAPRLHAFVGGSAHNAIPQNAIATFTSDHPETPRYLTVLRAALLASAPPQASIPVGPLGTAARASVLCLSAADSALFLQFLGQCPAGVLKANADGSPAISANVGIASLMNAVPDAPAQVVVNIRAHETAELDEWCAVYRRLGAEYGFDCSAPQGAPPWNQKPSAWVDRVLALGGAGWRAVKAHVGLECSAFAQKAPDLPLVSIGPTVLHPHSLAETLDTDTVADIAILIRTVIADT